MKTFEFELRINADRYLDYYRGTVRHVLVDCANGQSVQFPAALLQKFVTHSGVHGTFVLTCDDNHKCIELKRVGN